MPTTLFDKIWDAHEVAPGLIGQIHQHIFCARLDMAIDGDANSVVECNTYAEPRGQRIHTGMRSTYSPPFSSQNSRPAAALSRRRCAIGRLSIQT